MKKFFLFMNLMSVLTSDFIYAEKKSKKEGLKVETKATKNAPQLAEEIVLGQKDAPIKIIEYTSLACRGCALFNKEIFPQIKHFIDTGKVQYRIVEVPLYKGDLSAVVVARYICKNLGIDSYLKFKDKVLENQDLWVMDYKEKLPELSKEYISADEYNNISNNLEVLLDVYIAKNLQEAKDRKLSATPSIFINDEKVEITKVIDSINSALSKQMQWLSYNQISK